MRGGWDAIFAEAEALIGVPGLRLDRDRIRGFARAIAADEIGPGSNLFSEEPEPVGPDEVDALARFSAAERARRRELGARALDRGEVAVAVLNGGMATRFGGVVKGVLEAIGGRSFLEIKRAQAGRAGCGALLVMNSFATAAGTLEHLARRELTGVETFLQSVSIRLTPRGEAFRDARGALSLYAPGHGDFPGALRTSGWLEKLEHSGVRVVMLSNVDNLGADPDPVLIGYHLEHGRPLTCEVAEAEPGDVGGTPARVQGRVQVVEGFRFPPDFDFSRLRFLSTNTFLFSTELLAREFPLTWFYVEKRVDGRPAVQMERLVNELSSFVPTAFVATPRGGPDGRFLPVKSPDDLARLRADPALVARFTSLVSSG